MNIILFLMSVVSFLTVLYMYIIYIIYVGVYYCIHGIITCGYLRVLFGLWSSCLISILIEFPYGVVVLFGTCCDVPVLFIHMFLQSTFFICRFIGLLVLCLASLYVRLQHDIHSACSNTIESNKHYTQRMWASVWSCVGTEKIKKYKQTQKDALLKDEKYII
jgi:hypothetical protein